MTARQNWLRRCVAMMMAVVMVLTTNISTVFASEKQSTREIPETKPTAEIPENIADGTYEVPVYLYQKDADIVSDLNSAIDHTAKLVVENGMGTMYLGLHEIPFTEVTGYITEFAYYDPDGTQWGVAVDENGTAVNAFTGEEEQTLKKIHFALSTTKCDITCQMVVDVMEDIQDARLVFDYSGLAEYGGGLTLPY